MSYFIQNKKKCKKNGKIFKRVFTNRVLCGKLWEKLKWGMWVKRENLGFSRRIIPNKTEKS